MAPLYPYQKLARQHLLAGRNVIVQAPTGTGKTRTALLPYFEILDKYAEQIYPATAPLPLTCRYAVPMRVLATQFEREYHDHFAALDQRGTDLKRRYADMLGIKLPAIQTGETPTDPAFESPLTFCTIDQLLASFIGTPYSISKSQRNLNVGAAVGSYLILDEFHLYPLHKGKGARLTTLAMLKMLGRFSPFVLMTATFSTHLLQALAVELNAVVVRVDNPDELIEIMKGRERTIRRAQDVMTPSAILAAHEAARARKASASLVVCNTVARAQAIYQALRQELDTRGWYKTQLMLLHSRFTPEDRRKKGEILHEWLGKEQWKDGQFIGADTIVVGTQAIEVGLNISAGVLHTELASANSIIQRSGRSARFAQQVGEIIVYPIPPNERSGKVSYLPYEDDLCEATWKHLGEMIENNGGDALPFDFLCEQRLIDAVHTDEDRQMLDDFGRDKIQIEGVILKTLATHDRGHSGDLIRNVENVSVLVHEQPKVDITTRPFDWESFNLYPGTLQSAWDALRERTAALDIPWMMKYLIADSTAEEGSESDNSRETLYTWEPMKDPSQIRTAARIACHPQLATYDKELGFRLLLNADETSNGWQSKLINKEGDDDRGDTKGKKKGGKKPPTLGKQGSYVEHITGLMCAYDWSVRRELAWIARRVEQALELPDSSLDEAIRLAIACHDIGKLGREWQQWAREWQKLLVQTHGVVYTIQPGREFLAKTDRLPHKEEKVLRKQLQKPKPPTHACAGVIAGLPLIGQRLQACFGDPDRLSPEQQKAGEALLHATLGAIARHHTPLAKKYDLISWDPAAAAVVQKALKACRLDDRTDGLALQPLSSGEIGDQWLPAPERDDRLATLLAFILVRALRLCDQRAERAWGQAPIFR